VPVGCSDSRVSPELLDGSVRENVRRAVERLRTAEPTMIDPDQGRQAAGGRGALRPRRRQGGFLHRVTAHRRRATSIDVFAAPVAVSTIDAIDQRHRSN
jgi:hypothetical protein